MRLHSYTRRAGQKGATLVEAALVLTLLLMLLIGMIWISRAYNIYQTISHAAREGARLAVTPNCAVCGNTYPTDDAVRAVVDARLTVDGLDPTLTSPSPITIQRGVVLNPGSTPQVSGVVISFSYPVDLVLPFTTLGTTAISVSTQVQMRQE